MIIKLGPVIWLFILFFISITTANDVFLSPRFPSIGDKLHIMVSANSNVKDIEIIRHQYSRTFLKKGRDGLWSGRLRLDENSTEPGHFDLRLRIYTDAGSTQEMIVPYQILDVPERVTKLNSIVDIFPNPVLIGDPLTIAVKTTQDIQTVIAVLSDDTYTYLEKEDTSPSNNIIWYGTLPIDKYQRNDGHGYVRIKYFSKDGTFYLEDIAFEIAERMNDDYKEARVERDALAIDTAENLTRLFERMTSEHMSSDASMRAFEESIYQHLYKKRQLAERYVKRRLETSLSMQLHLHDSIERLRAFNKELERLLNSNANTMNLLTQGMTIDTWGLRAEILDIMNHREDFRHVLNTFRSKQHTKNRPILQESHALNILLINDASTEGELEYAIKSIDLQLRIISLKRDEYQLNQRIMRLQQRKDQHLADEKRWKQEHQKLTALLSDISEEVKKK